MSLPAVTKHDWPEWVERFDRFRPAFVALCDRLDADPATLRPMPVGTCVCAVAETREGRIYMKLFPPFLAGDFSAERDALSVLPHTLAAPRCLATHRADGWSALAVTEITGGPLPEAFVPDDRFIQELGGWIRALHDLVPGERSVMRTEARSWERFVTERCADIASHCNHAREGLGFSVASRVHAFAIEAPPVLVHADLTRDHIFVDETGSLTGIIDLADARLGHPAYEWPPLFLDLCGGDVDQLAHISDQAGLSAFIDGDMSARLTAMTLLNPFVFRDRIKPHLVGPRPPQSFSDIGKLVLAK